ncbi:MAG: hypothetical protein ACREEK_06200 [Bradyrhizobium sp.]
MDTDEQHAHFAWDLLDSAKRVTAPQVIQEPQGTRERGPASRSDPEPPPVSQFSEPGSTEQLRGMPMAEASLTVGSKPPAAVTQPAPEAQTEELFTLPVRSDPAPENEPPCELEPVPVRLPVTAQQSLPDRSDGDVPKLSWIDVGRSTEPGQYRSRYGLVEVRAQDIRIWKMHPRAAFAVMQPSPYSERNVSWLGSFDLGDQEQVAEDER